MEGAEQLLHEERPNSWDSAAWRRGLAVKDGAVLVRLAGAVSSPPLEQGLGHAMKSRLKQKEVGFQGMGIYC